VRVGDAASSASIGTKLVRIASSRHASAVGSRQTAGRTPAIFVLKDEESDVSGRSIYLVTTSGFPHYGDELVAAQWLRYLAVKEPDAQIWLDSHSPGNSQILLGDLHPNVRFVDTAFRIAWHAPSDDPAEAADFADRAIREPGLVARYALGIELLQTMDVFHVLGGSYINSIWPRHAALLAAGQTLATSYDTKAAMTGAALAPALAGSGFLDQLVKDFSVVDVRDDVSKGLLSGDQVTVTCDDVLIEYGDHIYDKRDSRSVMIATQSDLIDAGVEAVAESVAATLRFWQVTGEQVGYVESMPGPDRRVFDLIEAEFPGMRFYPFVELWREGLPARRGQRWITTRYHSHLLPALAQASGIAIPGKAGYSDIEHEALIAQGSRWSIVAPGEAATSYHGDPGFHPSKPAELIAAKRAIADLVYS
jgi:hypothetical protein